MDNIVQFPRRNKGRIRKTSSANAEGMLAIHQVGGGGDNIEIFNERRSDVIDRSEFVIYFLEKVFNKLPAETKSAVRLSALCDAALGKTDRDRIAGATLASMFGPRHAD